MVLAGQAMSNVSFVVPGNAVPLQSFRYARHGSYQPLRVRAWQEAVGWAARVAMGGQTPFTGPVRTVISFRLTHLRRVDCTNLNKAVEDACEGVVFVNDCQIVDQHVTKQQVKGGVAETRIMIEEIPM
jgi:Holliday junction resolvase RusA-like endonuclease